ncbi:MAG: DUF3883 domain-containing protein, partial [Planctomycetales bacterium]|nr:DUF3883 domain-containing protein [Planctomycetales bacterium]
TEAAGEGINLQFCWLMVNFDIPWNPVRLEQRVGRIHRYGQEKDCLIFNFVAKNTREGRVLQKLLDRLTEIRKDLGSDQVFDVVGEVFPANQLERLLREMYARQTDVHNIEDRIVRDVSPEKFRAITESTLEGLAKKELNLSAMVGKRIEAKERRLVPEVIEQFFVDAAPECGLRPKQTGKDTHIYRLGKTPRNLLPIGDAPEDRYGRLGREYKQIAFDKDRLRDDTALDWITPGHPLFEVVRHDILRRTEDHLRRGAVFLDIHRDDPALLDLFAASVKDGRGRTLHRRLFTVETALSGEMTLHEPTILLDIAPAPSDVSGPSESVSLPDKRVVEQFLYEHSLAQWGEEVAAERQDEVQRVQRHVEISLNALIDRAQFQLAEYLNRKVEGQTVTGLDGLIAQAEQHLDTLNNRLETRQRELELERHSSIADINHLGRVWVMPHPARTNPEIAPLVRDDQIEHIAIEFVKQYEQSRGWVVESVEDENRGYDLISRCPDPSDPKSFLDVRFIEVKGRAGVGIVALSPNEYRTADRMKSD